MTVFDLKKGEKKKISSINLSGGERARLDALGIRTGVYVCVLGYSLFKSSILVSCAAVRVALRRALAEKIEVEQ